MLQLYHKKYYKNEDDYDKLLNKFDELDYEIKKRLEKKINFDKKYDKEIYIEIADIIGYQIEKVTRTFEILSENDIDIVLNQIEKNINENYQRLSDDTKKKFLCFRKWIFIFLDIKH